MTTRSRRSSSVRKAGVKKGKKSNRTLISLLKKKRISDVLVRGSWVSLTYDGRRIRDRIIKKKHEKHVAEWSRRNKNLLLDDDIKGKSILFIVIHEAVEKYVTQRYGLNVDKESHKIAQAVERAFVINHCRHDNKKCWRSHEQKITWVIQ